MSYVDDYKKSKLMKNGDFTRTLDRIMSLPTGKKLTLVFSTERDLRRFRYNLYSFLRGMKVKDDFILEKNGRYLEVTVVALKPTVVGEIKEVSK